MSFRIKTILPIIIILVAAFLRFFRFAEFVTFLGDQGRDAIIIKRIVTFEHWPAIGAPSSLGQIFLGPFYYYLVAPFLLLFNFNPVGLAYGVALLTLIGIIVAYLVVKKEFGFLTSIVFLIFLSFSFLSIQSSRFSWNPNLLPVFSFFTLYFFYKFLTDKNKWYAISFGAFLSFSIQLHHLTFLLFLPILLIYFIFSVKNKTMRQWNNLIISVISFLFFSLPLIIFDLRHDFLNTKNFATLLTEGNPATNTNYLNKFWETNNAFYTHVFQTPFNQNISILITIIIAVWTLILLKNKKNLFLLINLLSFIFYLISFSAFNTARIAHYFNPVYFSFFLILAWLLSEIPNKFKNLKVLIAVVLIFYLNLNLQNTKYLFNTQGNNQIKNSEKIAQSIIDHDPETPYQTIALPYVETDGHIRYFLEINGKRPLAADTLTNPKELYVLCFEKDPKTEDGWCQVLGNAQWQIAAFRNAKIDQAWIVEGVKVYKLIHRD